MVCEDFAVASILAVEPPLALSTWTGRTGLSELPPMPGQSDWLVWAQRLRLDLRDLRAYAHAVNAATDAALATLVDSRASDGSGGSDSPAHLLSAVLLTVAMRRGEIACLLAEEQAASADTRHG